MEIAAKILLAAAAGVGAILLVRVVRRSGTSPDNVDTATADWAPQEDQAPQAPPVDQAQPARRRILVVGDSITVGYLPRFKKLVEAAGHEVIGEGVSGAQTTRIHTLMTKYLAQKPTDVVILGGVNDLASGVGWRKTSERLAATWKDARPARVVAVTVLPWACYSKYKADDTAKLNTFILGAQGQSFGPDVVVNTRPLGDDAGCLRNTRDKLHPDAIGQQLLAESVMVVFQ
jgi:lysophospholipase L1-like esterase